MRIIWGSGRMVDVDAGTTFLEDQAFLAGGAAGLFAAEQEQDPILAFFDNLRRAMLESFDRSTAVAGPPSVFVFSGDNPRQTARDFDPSVSRITDINIKDPDDWQGKLVFAPKHGTNGWYVPLPDGSADAALELLESKGLGGLPVAIVYPEKRTLSCYKGGGTDDGEPIRLDLPAAVRKVTINDIFEVLEDVRKHGLLTPAKGPPGFWTDGANYVPGPESERHIQWIVQQQLRSNFRPILVDTEQETEVGRIDIVMTDTNAAHGKLHPAIIELKALRSKTHNDNAVSATANLKAVVKGMRQAKAYRHAKQARYAVLACYDMRQVKTDMFALNVVVLAQAKYLTDDDIKAFILPIYGLTDDAQDEYAAA
jgi:Holliday junction resolvase-like predicted endonuclease